MIAVIGMGVIMYTAKAIIEEMGQHDQYNGWYEEPVFVMDKKQLEYQQTDTRKKQDKG